MTRRNERDKFPDRNFVRPTRDGGRAWGEEGGRRGRERARLHVGEGRKHGDRVMEGKIGGNSGCGDGTEQGDGKGREREGPQLEKGEKWRGEEGRKACNERRQGRGEV